MILDVDRVARSRVIAAGALEVIRWTATDGVQWRKLSHGWWEIKAYDAEVYWLSGNRLSGWAITMADMVEPDYSEPFCSREGHDEITVACSAGAEVRLVKRGDL